MSKKEKAHLDLIPDAPDPARLHLGACGGSETENRCGPVSLVEAIDQLELPPEIAQRREGESAHDHTLRTLPHVLRALTAKFGPLPEETSAKDLRFLAEMILWSQRNRAIKRIEQRHRNREYEDPPNDAA